MSEFFSSDFKERVWASRNLKLDVITAYSIASGYSCIKLFVAERPNEGWSYGWSVHTQRHASGTQAYYSPTPHNYPTKDICIQEGLQTLSRHINGFMENDKLSDTDYDMCKKFVDFVESGEPIPIQSNGLDISTLLIIINS